MIITTLFTCPLLASRLNAGSRLYYYKLLPSLNSNSIRRSRRFVNVSRRSASISSPFQPRHITTSSSSFIIPKEHGARRNALSEQWAEKLFAPEPAVLAEARARAVTENVNPINIAPHEGKILSLLLKLHGARKVVEIGTLFGYSGVWIAWALPKDNGHLWTIEVSRKNAAIAMETFEQAGVASQVTLLRGTALDILSDIEQYGPFDAVFIDADKANYLNYLYWAERNVRKGGLVIGDNTYYFGHIHEDTLEEERSTKGLTIMKEFNTRVADPKLYDSVLLPTGDGMTVGIKLF